MNKKAVDLNQSYSHSTLAFLHTKVVGVWAKNVFVRCVLVTCFCLLGHGKSTSQHVNFSFPEKLLHKQYSVQCLSVDSIHQVLQAHDSRFIDSVYTSYEKKAAAGRDIQLHYLFLLKQCFNKITNKPEDTAAEKYILSLINELADRNLAKLKSEALHILAMYYWANKRYAPALEYYIYAHDIYTAFSAEEFPHKAEYLYDFGSMHYYFRDLVAAKRYFLEAWHTIPPALIPNNVSKLNTLALVYSGLDAIDSSDYYYTKAYDLAVKNNDEIWIGIISGNLSNNYYKRKKYDEAITLIRKNIDFSERFREMTDLATSYSRYGELLLMKNEVKKALEMELKSLEIITQKDMLQNHAITVRIYPNVAKAYAANGNMALAYSYSNLAYIANEAWQKERNAIILSGVQHKVDLEKHRAAIQKTQDEVSHQKFLLYSFAIGLLIVLIALGMFLSQQGKLKNTHAKLIQSEKMAVLGQLAANIAHEVNTPLGAIKSSSEESMNTFPEILHDLSWLMHTLSEEDKKAFVEFLVTSNPASQTLSTKEEREIKKKIRDTFTELGVENNRYLADRLVQVGIYDIQPELRNIAGHEHFGKLMQLTYTILNQQRSNQTVHLAVEKASRIVKALKTYIHTSNSDEMDTINIRDNIETVLTIYHNRLKQGIQVVKNYEDVHDIVGYPDKLNQVWTNLIVNAVQAMDNSGILTIGIKQEGNYAMVSIHDTGKGIPKSIESKIFDPFFTTKRKGEGSGLGLDIIKRIVEEHNATISFRSIEGEGTTFYVQLPTVKTL